MYMYMSKKKYFKGANRAIEIILKASFNPFSTGTGCTLYKVYGGFRISYGTG